MKTFLLFFFFALINREVVAIGIYPVSAIPEELKKDVNVVVREDEITFTILSKNKAKVHHHLVATIFNSKGSYYAEVSIGYDKMRSISNLKANVYGAEGLLIRKLKSGDISDQSEFDGFSLYSDNRVKEFNLKMGSYPYTIEYEYDTEYNYLYSITGSYVLSGENVAVQHFVYRLNFPKELKPRYKAINLDTKPEATHLPNGSESLTWIVENVKPIVFEPHASSRSMLPQILAAPNEFEYSGYGGSMATWLDYGNWQMTLNKGRDVLPEATKQKVRDLTRGLTTDKEKAKVIYEYLQSKTRYVGIQLGIGGLQPFEASVVDQNGYGDCKALSNYMVAMLKEAGVRSFYATIMAGRNVQEVLTDFPSHQANHVIVAVPNAGDTIWLECTSQTTPFGYMGQNTDDRYAMLVSEEGGKLVRTTAYPAEKNLQTRNADVVLDAMGNAKAKTRTTYAGLQYENGYLSHYVNQPAEEQKKWIQENSGIPNFDVASFSIVNRKELIPSATVNSDLILNRYASVSGKRLFLTPNLMNRSTYIPPKVENRKSEVSIRMGYIDYDTIRFQIPENLYPEFVPAPAKYSTPFGEYEATMEMDQGSLIYIRKMRINKGNYPAETYQEFVDFYRNVNKADNIKLVFLSRT